MKELFGTIFDLLGLLISARVSLDQWENSATLFKGLYHDINTLSDILAPLADQNNERLDLRADILTRTESSLNALISFLEVSEQSNVSLIHLDELGNKFSRISRTHLMFRKIVEKADARDIQSKLDRLYDTNNFNTTGIQEFIAVGLLFQGAGLLWKKELQASHGMVPKECRIAYLRCSIAHWVHVRKRSIV
eukprot:NODE_261_length_12589_cov_0.423139.p5 type:complete len:192 gc:universal NODE_261_length_12589_cov_0.423139:5021-5596(+)